MMLHAFLNSLVFVAQSHSCCSSVSCTSQDGQPLPGDPDYHHRPQSHAAGGPTDAADAGYSLDYTEKTAASAVIFFLLTFFSFSCVSCHPGNMRGFGMGGQQFRQFFTPGSRSSLLGPVPMGMAIKSPMMGFPAARPFHPHARYYNTPTTASSSSSASSITTAVITQHHYNDYNHCVGYQSSLYTTLGLHKWQIQQALTIDFNQRRGEMFSLWWR